MISVRIADSKSRVVEITDPVKGRIILEWSPEEIQIIHDHANLLSFFLEDDEDSDGD